MLHPCSTTQNFNINIGVNASIDADKTTQSTSSGSSASSISSPSIVRLWISIWSPRYYEFEETVNQRNWLCNMAYLQTCFETMNSLNNSPTTFIACMQNIGEDTLSLYVDVVWEQRMITVIWKKKDCGYMPKIEGTQCVPSGKKIIGMGFAMALHYGGT